MISAAAPCNAIPARGPCQPAGAAASVADFKALVDRYAGIYQSELAATEANLTVLLTAREKPAQLMSESLQPRLLDAWMACPNGVMRMSDAIPGVTGPPPTWVSSRHSRGSLCAVPDPLPHRLVKNIRQMILLPRFTPWPVPAAKAHRRLPGLGLERRLLPVMALVRSSYQTVWRCRTSW